MLVEQIKPVLIIGGSGVVGSKAARTLREMHPELPIAIGGRDFTKAADVAAGLGNAIAVKVDLEHPKLGNIRPEDFSAVSMFLKDNTLNSLRFAQSGGIPYIDISTAAFEIAPMVAQYSNNPNAAPVLMNGTWLAGAATLPALHYAREFEVISSVRIAATLDEQDMGGPAASADFERQTGATSNALVLNEGSWTWIGGEAASRKYRTTDDQQEMAQPYPLLDPICLGSALNLKEARFDLTYGVSAGRRAGGHFTSEIVIEIEGRKVSGHEGAFRLELTHPEGQAPLTAVCVSAALERLIGLVGGEAVKPGLYMPSNLIDPQHVIDRLTEFGAIIRRD